MGMRNPQTGYAAKLRVAVECDGWSINKLAKELAARTGNSVETERSAIRGYLKESTPRPERAELIADIMEMPELAVVENPRQSGAARLEVRLEALAGAVAEILQNQRMALSVQESLSDALLALREELELARTARQDVPKHQDASQ